MLYHLGTRSFKEETRCFGLMVLPISSHSTEVSAIAMYNVHGHKLCSQAVEEMAWKFNLCRFKP